MLMSIIGIVNTCFFLSMLIYKFPAFVFLCTHNTDCDIPDRNVTTCLPPEREMTRMQEYLHPQNYSKPTTELKPSRKCSVILSWLHFVLSPLATEPVPVTLLHTHDNTASLCFFWPARLVLLACPGETWPPKRTTARESQCGCQP